MLNFHCEMHVCNTVYYIYAQSQWLFATVKFWFIVVQCWSYIMPLFSYAYAHSSIRDACVTRANVYIKLYICICDSNANLGELKEKSEFPLFLKVYFTSNLQYNIEARKLSRLWKQRIKVSKKSLCENYCEIFYFIVVFINYHVPQIKLMLKNFKYPKKYVIYVNN